ncbi:MAG: hypothetical protein ACOYOT_00435 [Bacteroidales bacterium]
MKDNKQIGKESDDAACTDGALFSAIDTSDSGKVLSESDSSPVASPSETPHHTITVTINQSYRFSIPLIRISNHSEDSKTHSVDSVVTFSSYYDPSADAGDSKSCSEVSPNALGKGIAHENTLPNALSSVSLNRNSESNVLGSVSLNGISEPNALGKTSLNKYSEPNALGRVSPAKDVLLDAKGDLPIWSAAEFAFANEQALVDLAQFMAERKRLRRQFLRQRAQAPSQIVQWRRWARRRRLGWLAVLLSMLRGFELMVYDLLSLLDDVIELSADGAFYTTDYSRPISPVWYQNYTSGTAPCYHENYSSTDVVKETEVCNVKIKTRKAKIEVYIHSFYKGVSMTLVAGRAPPLALLSAA